MKLLTMIVRDIDDEVVVQALVGKGYRVTRMASTGGFLHKGNVTLLAGVEDHQVEDVMSLLHQACRPVDPEQHRATVFVVDLPVYIKV